MTVADERLLRLLKDARDKLESERRHRSEPLAIVGIGCRFPGGASDPEAFWQLLEAGVDATSEVPIERWDANALYDPDPATPGKAYARRGGFLDTIDTFEPEFFGISPREAIALDPQQRLLLEVSWEALEDAGIVPERLRGSRTGVWVALALDDYAGRTLASGDLTRIDAYSALGTARSVAAGRIAYVLDLHGPVMQIDASCASSLVALHLACQSLRTHECDQALVGGVNVMSSPEATVALCKLQALARDGRCKTFDANADGYARGEGCGVVVLKRLSDARTAGDRIHAVIRGTAVNHDGRSNGLTAPNGAAQEAVIRDALANAEVAPSSVGYVEAHGTGTLLGDPIEVHALGRVYGSRRHSSDVPLFIGSVKTNFGHLEAAAGIAGLIKTALSLSHRRLAPHLHFLRPNPGIPWKDLAIQVATNATDWPREGASRIAGVSAFGISGTNAHVLVEQAPEAEPRPAAPGRSAELVLLSARTDAALRASAERLRHALEAHPDWALGDLAYTLLTTRSPMERRWAFAVPTTEALSEALAAATADAESSIPEDVAGSSGHPKVAFVFPGQGSQWLGMGRQLLVEEPAFRDAMTACDQAIAAETGWSVLEKLGASPQTSRLEEVEVVQPVLFAMEVALAALWRSWGVEPDAVVGHSMGEVAAACVSGALSLTDGAAIICRRSALLRQIRGQGQMALVELPMTDAQTALAGFEDRLGVAASNGQRSTVLSGEPKALAQVLTQLEARGVFCRRVKVDVASHSPQVDPLLDPLLAALAGLQPRAARVPMHSTVTATILHGAELGPRYWVDNLRRPVCFAQVIETLCNDGFSLFVEMSPHPLLVSAIQELRQHLNTNAVAVGSLRREQPERLTLLQSLGALHIHGLQLNEDALHPFGALRLALPTYPWQRRRYWLDAAPVNRIDPRIIREAASGIAQLVEHGSLSPSERAALQELLAVGRPNGSTVGLASDDRARHKDDALGWSTRLGLLPANRRHEAAATLVRSSVARLLLLSTANDVPPHRPLKDLGLDSLMSLELRRTLSLQTGFELPVNLVLRFPTAQEIAEYLLTQPTDIDSRGSEQAAGSDWYSREETEGPVRFQEDAVLDQSVKGLAARTDLAEPGHVFLTGATGFLGAFLLSELLQQGDTKVTCLVRATDPSAGLDRIVNNLKQCGLWTERFRARIFVCVGNLDQDRFGLHSTDFDRLADSVEAIYNNGALLTFIGRYSDLKPSHVHGTRQVLLLASTGRPKTIHHISSVDVFDAVSYRGQRVEESARPTRSDGVRLPYAQCKWVTESLVWAAAERGVPVTVHRPSFIGGSSVNGAWNPADFIYCTLKAGIEMRCLPGDLDLEVELSPVDYVSRSIAYLSRQTSSVGNAFHLHNPRPIRVDALVRILRGLGFEIELIPYWEWVARVQAETDAPLHPLLPFLAHRWPPEGLTYVELGQRAYRPHLTCERTTAALAPAGIECPKIDSVLIGRYIDRMIATGALTVDPNRASA